MPEKVLYSHDPAKEIIGYQVLARSRSANPVSQLAVGRFVRDLRIRAADLEGSQGWTWSELDGRFCLARMVVLRSANGNRILEYRLLLLSGDEAELIEFQPFSLAELMCRSEEWKVRSQGQLPDVPDNWLSHSKQSSVHLRGSMRLPLELPWLPEYSGLPEFIARLLSVFPKEQRKKLEVRAPDVKETGELQIRIGISATSSPPEVKAGAFVSGRLLRATCLAVSGLLAMAVIYGCYSTWQWNGVVNEYVKLEASHGELTKKQDELSKILQTARDGADEQRKSREDLIQTVYGKLKLLQQQIGLVDSPEIGQQDLDFGLDSAVVTVDRLMDNTLIGIRQRVSDLQNQIDTLKNRRDWPEVWRKGLLQFDQTLEALKEVRKSISLEKVDLQALKKVIEDAIDVLEDLDR